jgi:hypothetical protein
MFRIVGAVPLSAVLATAFSAGAVTHADSRAPQFPSSVVSLPSIAEGALLVEPTKKCKQRHPRHGCNIGDA